jgi:hypothetical protein
VVCKLRSFGPLRAPRDDSFPLRHTDRHRLADRHRPRIAAGLRFDCEELGSVGEEAGLGGGGGLGFAASDADDAEDGEFTEGGAGDEDAVGGGVQVGRGDVEAVVEEAEEVVGDHAFEGVAVDEAEADPEAVELGAAEEGFALGLEVVGKLADEIDRADFGERDLLVLAVGCEQVDGVGFAETGRV